jgi:hypothetical protein
MERNIKKILQDLINIFDKQFGGNLLKSRNNGQTVADRVISIVVLNLYIGVKLR